MGGQHSIDDQSRFGVNVVRMNKGHKGAGELIRPSTDAPRSARHDKSYLGSKEVFADPRAAQQAFIDKAHTGNIVVVP
ncbi:hypothetical protein [Thalassococcus sp. S3]|uniref:hypothetical protein n=1 Tax=Thalassococcus sp. S3 TaxID=2017482 RepID=UPI0010246519|nr:hypothetical protein [Thalassococcus sp. S3]QBF32119.1 hypothetical protein CFI11_12940 [Thalassococcus sp. S3]